MTTTLPPPALAPAAPHASPPNPLAHLTLVAATVLAGLAAGFFWTYEASVTRGLAVVDDTTYVHTFQAINNTIRNPVFGIVFFGTLPALLLAAGTNWRTSSPARRWLLASAPALFLCCMAITGTQNVPLNNELGEVTVTATNGEAASAARADFEDVWNQHNLVRTVAAIASFAAVVGATSLGRDRRAGSAETAAALDLDQTG